ncbi:LysR family transcriptional regulator [Rhizobium laguerreae]|uniref:LysR family transcriptional regulator n=1 Tax=Rhizobium laguerreae TaxID=1076926 RepID=UPI001C92B4D3|nr:LysR family transcriptional regulator [Rhizobium laguerreae]MBY3466122.1 LysR family transcriptional regulator [Rhizobium laguerreae]
MAQNHRHLDWNDLRCVLAVAEHGGLAAAARALGVNHTTVLRRVNAFEEAQGLRLFERLPSGYLVTPGGEELLASVRQISSLVTDLERRLTGRDLRLEGVLRVATTDTLASSILPQHLAAFHVRYPDIVVELAVGNLPCYLGDVVPERLVRLGEPLPDAVSELWLLMHADLSRTARVRAFNTFMAGALAGERDLLEGRRDRSSRSR